MVSSRKFHAPAVMLALALVGLAVALYDSYVIYNGQPLWCPPPIDGCNEVAASPYARILGLPVGYYGVVYYLYMFGLAALLAFDPLSPGLRLGAVLYAGWAWRSQSISWCCRSPLSAHSASIVSSPR
jgi:uncharacterized membrane protein